MRGADVIQGFESIGDSCEFGFVQHQFGLAPISLLRWAGCSLDGLIRALHADFDELFAAADLRQGSTGVVVDTKYDIYYHSELRFDGDALLQEPDNLARHRRLMTDVRFRRRLFGETLAERAKILVFKSSRALPMADILRLKAALDTQVPQRLLCVVKATPERPAGTMELVASGVKLGALARLAPGPHQDQVDLEGWLDLCAKAVMSDWDTGEAAPAFGPAVQAGADGEPPRIMCDRFLAGALGAALYRTVLLREPDMIDLAETVESALRHRRTMEDLIEQILLSPAFAATRHAFLSRYCDPGWARQLSHVFPAARPPVQARQHAR